MKKSKIIVCFLFSGLLIFTLSCKNDKRITPDLESQIFTPGCITGAGENVGVAYIFQYDSVIIIGAEKIGKYIGVGPGYIEAVTVYCQKISNKFAADAYKANITKPELPFSLYVDANSTTLFRNSLFLERNGKIESIKSLYILYGPDVMAYRIINDQVHARRLSFSQFYEKEGLSEENKSKVRNGEQFIAL